MESLTDDRTATPTTVVIVARGVRPAALARRHGMALADLTALNPGIEQGDGIQSGSAVVVFPSPDHPESGEEDLSIELARGIRGRKNVALTFDAAWVTQEQIERLLDILDRHNVPATFFLTGTFIRQHPGAARMIADRHFPVHNHTRSHPHCKKLSDDEIRAELLDLDRAIEESAGFSTWPFWRPPFGERDKRILTAAASVGFRSVYWTIDSLDWVENPPRTAEMIFDRICKMPFQQENKKETDDRQIGTERFHDPLDGAILLFHIGGKSTPDAINRIIPYLKEKYYRFVTIPDLIRP